MKDSIIVNMEYAQYDIIDGNPSTERHHIFGGPNRKLSDEDGLWVPLTKSHHTEDKISAHKCKEFQTLLHIIGQLAYEKHQVADGKSEKQARECFRKRYGRSFL